MAVAEIVANAAVNAAAEAALEEPGQPDKLVVIKPDKGESESNNEEAEDHEASYLEAL